MRTTHLSGASRLDCQRNWPGRFAMSSLYRGLGSWSLTTRSARRGSRPSSASKILAWRSRGGIAALGVIAFRSVVERRQQIGMLRAIGCQTESIALTFVLESTFVAAMGILSGVVGGLIVSRNLFTTGQFSGEGVDFTMPWGEVAVFVGLVLIVSLIMTWWPSRSAARVPVPEALRYE